MFYAKSTGGFYSEEINGKNIPCDAVAISAADYRALIDGQSSGSVISTDKKGLPKLASPAASSPEKMAEEIRAERGRKMSACDWTQLADCQLQASEIAEWKKYRQSLRDITDQAGFPENVVWPKII